MDHPVAPLVEQPAQGVARLPESFGIKPNPDYTADIDKYFGGTEEANKESPAVVEPPKLEVKIEPAPGSLADKLAAKKSPVVPVKAEVPAAPVVPVVDDPIAKIEAEMKAHNKNWKPAQGWEQLKTTVSTERARAAQLEKELQEAKTARAAEPIVAGMTSDQIKELQAREKAASDRLLVLSLEDHPNFRAQYVEPKNAAIDEANQLLAMHGVKGDVASLIAKPRSEIGKALAELVKDIPDFDKVQVAEAVRKAHSLDQSGRAALTQSKDLQKQIKNQTVERQKAAFENRWLPVSASIGEHAVSLEVPPTATAEERAGIEDYNASLKNLKNRAEEIAFSPVTEETIAENSMKAAAYDFHIQKAMPRIIGEYEQVVNLNRQLVAELNALRSRNPNRGISASPPAVEHGSTVDMSKMGHTEAAEYLANKR